MLFYLFIIFFCFCLKIVKLRLRNASFKLVFYQGMRARKKSRIFFIYVVKLVAFVKILTILKCVFWLYKWFLSDFYSFKNFTSSIFYRKFFHTSLFRFFLFFIIFLFLFCFLFFLIKNHPKKWGSDFKDIYYSSVFLWLLPYFN